MAKHTNTTQRKSNSKVWLLASGFVVLVLLCIGAYCLFAKNTPLGSISDIISPHHADTKQPVDTDTQQPVDAQTLKIPELGIELVNIPASLADMNYAVNPHGKPSDSMTVAFSTISIGKLSDKCSPSSTPNGALTRKEGEYVNFPYKERIPLLKQFKGFWVYYESPQSSCSSDPEAQSLNVTQVKDTRELLSNPDNIQAIQ